jgi:hypothetical protein
MSKPESGAAVKLEDPAIEEADKADDKVADKAPKADEKTDERRKEDREDGPPPDSPRWKEVYGKWKATERRLEEREKDFDAIREHNQALEARLNVVEKNKVDRPSEPEPDPAVDPDAYKKWHEMKRLQEKQEWDKQRAVDRHENQVEMQKELHDDYLDVIKIVERDMVKDAALKNKIWNAPNPAKEAYVYGKMRAKEMEEKEREEQSRETTKKQVATEPSDAGGGGTDEPSEEKLSEAEVRVCKNLFPEMKLEDAKKKYIKQKKALGRV